MISASDRSKSIERIDEAVISKARLFKACNEIGITERTYYRWIKQLKNRGTVEDLRLICERPTPTNKRSKEEIKHHRGRSEEPHKRPIATHVASAPNKVWMWDITYLNGPVKGDFYYLYLISD